jgi:hypothetical protein
MFVEAISCAKLHIHMDDKMVDHPKVNMHEYAWHLLFIVIINKDKQLV